MTHHICKTCGGGLVNIGDAWKCNYCGNIYEDDSVKKEEEMLRSLLDEVKTEKVANLRRNLYDALNAKYIDSESIVGVCRRIKEYLPDDFMANFYEIANSNDNKRTAEAINAIDAVQYADYIDGILKFMIKSFTSDVHLPLVNLVERAYAKRDKQKFEQFHTAISEEALKDNEGVYQTSLSRDAFIAYSSYDMDKVFSLASTLEENGFSCFIAARNLRHGRGAVQNYQAAIYEALNNCTCIIFVSTPNSRNFSCDAIRFELPYIKQCDINNAPPQYKHNYATLPAEYKKPRIEYRVKESPSPTAGDRFVKDIFIGFEFAYSEDEVVARLIESLTALPNIQPTVPAEPAVPDPVVQNVKYCISCGSENPESTKFCGECGNNTFAATPEEADLKRQIEEMKKQLEENKAQEAAPSAATSSSGNYTVRMDKCGPSKLNVIKVIREYCGVGLAEAKKLSETPAVDLIEPTSQSEAQKFANDLAALGATVKVVPVGTSNTASSVSAANEARKAEEARKASDASAVKYCAYCESPNPADARMCKACGYTSFLTADELAESMEAERKRREGEAKKADLLQQVTLAKKSGKLISAGAAHTVGINSDGSAVATKYTNDPSYYSGESDVSDWRDLAEISAGAAHTVGLKKDGSVVAVGSNKNGQSNVSGWRDIASVSAGGYFTVGLKKNGQVIATGANDFGQCNVSDWRDIVEISAGRVHTVGLKKDGRVAATRYTQDSQSYFGQCDVSGWMDIVSVCTGFSHTVGLKKDGRVVAVGKNAAGQCNVSGWTDIVAIAAGSFHTVGLKRDGRVVATQYMGEPKSNYGQCNVSGWTDIVAIAAGYAYTLGLKKDGTIVAVGNNLSGQCGVSEWNLFKAPKVSKTAPKRAASSASSSTKPAPTSKQVPAQKSAAQMQKEAWAKKALECVQYLAFDVDEKRGGYSVRIKDSNNCPEEIVIPETYNGSKVVSILYKAFFECDNLKSLVTSDSIKHIEGYAFAYSSLEKLYLGDNVFSFEGKIFDCCRKFKTVTVSEGNKFLVGENNVVYNKDKSVLLLVAPGVSGRFEVPYGVKTIGDHAFAGCDNITSITLPNTLTAIGKYAFAYSDITEINLPFSINTIKGNAFSGCKIRNIVIPDGVTRIESFTFSHCEELESITIPSSVKLIDTWALAYCKSLKNITYKGRKDQWFEIERNEWHKATRGFKIYCTNGTMNSLFS